MRLPGEKKYLISCPVWHVWGSLCCLYFLPMLLPVLCLLFLSLFVYYYHSPPWLVSLYLDSSPYLELTAIILSNMSLILFGSLASRKVEKRYQRIIRFRESMERRRFISKVRRRKIRDGLTATHNRTQIVRYE